MIKKIREQYNANYTDEKYKAFLDDINKTYDHVPAFRIAESPVFIGKEMRAMLEQAAREIVDVIVRPDFKQLSQGAILPELEVPGETPHTTFLQLDFGICSDGQGGYIPQLIEVQGFPSLYFYQHLVAQMYRKHFDIPESVHHLFGGIDDTEYIELLRRIIVSDYKPENVVLLEVEPKKQVTQIDFWGTRHHLGIPVCCISDLKKEGKDVYYINEQGRKVQVQRIYNRVIFDELAKRQDLQREFYFGDESNVEYIGHPHWFFRISKHTMPYLNSRFVPACHFVSDLDQVPDDLENYVLKPLYSFSGSGVIIDVTPQDLDSIDKPEQYILQRKVEYAPVVNTPSESAKCEVRLLMLWEQGQERPTLVNNLVRLSKGKMIGVKYNKDKDWVGGSVGFFEI